MSDTTKSKTAAVSSGEYEMAENADNTLEKNLLPMNPSMQKIDATTPVHVGERHQTVESVAPLETITRSSRSSLRGSNILQALSPTHHSTSSYFSPPKAHIPTSLATPTSARAPQQSPREQVQQSESQILPRLPKTAAQLKMKEEAVERAHRKKLMDARVARVTNSYMEKSGGDLGKAAGLWFEREEQKARRPWSVLKECTDAIEAMKTDSLDPQMLRQQMKERAHKSIRSRFKRQYPTSSMRDTLEPVSLPKNGLPTARPKERLVELPNNELLNNPTETLTNPNLAPEASDKQLTSSAVLQDVGVLLTQKASLPPLPPSPRRKRTASKSPTRRKRRRVDEDLGLGENWIASFTNDGHRPCTRIRQEKASEHKPSER